MSDNVLEDKKKREDARSQLKDGMMHAQVSGQLQERLAVDDPKVRLRLEGVLHKKGGPSRGNWRKRLFRYIPPEYATGETDVRKWLDGIENGPKLAYGVKCSCLRLLLLSSFSSECACCMSRCGLTLNARDRVCAASCANRLPDTSRR